MPNEGMGMLLMVALGALALSGGKIGKPTTKAGSIVGDTMPREQPTANGFDIAGYIETLFGQTATVPEQRPMTFIYPADRVVTSSGVPAVIKTAAEIITPTTKVQIGGEGGETIVASSLAIIRQEQLDKQRFQAAANVQTPKTEATAAFNRDEEARQKAFADNLIRAAREEQSKRNAMVVARTREQQENIARGFNFDGSPRTLPAGMSVITADRPPTINYDRETAADDEGLSFGSTAGQDIITSATTEFIDVDFTPEYSESFVISSGMEGPAVSEDEQPGSFVHELTAQYEIGF
jgi:hypothetical protein